VASTNKDNWKGNAVLLKPSKFRTVVIDAVNDPDPQQKILSTIDTHDLDDCVVKIVYSVKPQNIDSINIDKIKEKLTNTSFYSITPVVVQNSARTSLPEIDATYYNSPLKALEKYLNQRSDLNKQSLLEKAQLLMQELA
jgi:DNA repair protein SbcD/Mre11